MDKKGWIGSDIVFDIDADHIPTSCNKIHDEFRCVKCGFEGRGITPDACPCCEAKKFEVRIWACDLCIEAARDEVIKLLDMLQKTSASLSMNSSFLQGIADTLTHRKRNCTVT